MRPSTPRATIGLPLHERIAPTIGLLGAASTLARSAALAARMAALADGAGLVLLLVATALLLLRPSDLLPGLDDAPVYEMVMAACLVVSLPRMLGQLGALRANGIAVLLLLMVPIVVLAHLLHADLYDARLDGMDMAKSCTLFI